MPSSMNMDNWNVNNIKRKYAANKFVEKNRTEWLEVSTEERQKLIEKFKTVFCKNFEPNSEPDNLSEYDDFIGEQVMRLKYYGMSQLLDMKLDIKLVWDKTPNAELKRGWFDPLPPEELERRKREFQASQPLKELFSATELEALFAELPAYPLTPEAERQCRCGASFPARGAKDGEYRFIAGTGEFLALGRIQDGHARSIKSFFEVS